MVHQRQRILSKTKQRQPLGAYLSTTHKKLARASRQANQVRRECCLLEHIKYLCCALTLFIIGCSSVPQTPLPNTDVYVADIDIAAGTVKNVLNITQRPGYDNQPSFSADGNAIFFVSDRSGSTDIYRYDLATSVTSQTTDTDESEFSPTPMNDGKSFSAVRVGKPHAEGEEYTESQQLWRYDFTGRAIAPILGIRRVGYHCWMDEGLVALFIVGNDEKGLPHRLIAADLASRQTIDLASNIGRSIKQTPDGLLSFVDKSDSTSWMISTIAQGDDKPTPLIATPKGSEDFCWMPDGTLLAVDGKSIVQSRASSQKLFKHLATFTELGGTLARITANADGTRIAFVVVTPE